MFLPIGAAYPGNCASLSPHAPTSTSCGAPKRAPLLSMEGTTMASRRGRPTRARPGKTASPSLPIQLCGAIACRLAPSSRCTLVGRPLTRGLAYLMWFPGPRFLSRSLHSPAIITAIFSDVTLFWIRYPNSFRTQSFTPFLKIISLLAALRKTAWALKFHRHEVHAPLEFNTILTSPAIHLGIEQHITAFLRFGLRGTGLSRLWLW